MKAFYVCQQKFYDDGKTKQGGIRYLTIDGGWSELIEYATIHKENHAKYLSEKHQKSFRDYCAGFFAKEAKMNNVEEKKSHCDYCRKEFPISELKWVRTTSALACCNCMAGALADFDAFCEDDD